MTVNTRLPAAAVAAFIVLSGASLGAAPAATAPPSREVLTQAVKQYLADHGDLCVGKFAWPRVVTAEDRQARTNDAVQLPVLERLGLVQAKPIATPAGAKPASWNAAAADSGASIGGQGTSTADPAAADGFAKSYSLTAKGRKYFLKKKRITVGAHDLPTEHDADLCVGRLTLDQVIKWTPPEQVNGHMETVVRYTYHLSTADWIDDPEARRVFPVIDRIIRHEDNMLMSVTARLVDGRWEPVLPTRR